MHVGTITSLVVILILIMAWRDAGVARVAGYWAGAGGAMYRIAPTASGQLAMTTTSGLYGARVGASYPVCAGAIGITAQLPNKKMRGWFSIDGRRIHWRGATARWVKQRV